jgi:hypothetical protein
LRVEFRERTPFARRSPLIARTGAGIDLVAAEPLIDIADEAWLAVFAVVDHVDAEIDLPLHDLAHGAAQPAGIVVSPEVRSAALQEFEKIGRPRQAARMSREDAIGAVLHMFVPNV